ncbi:MAG: DUF3109 family protein [Clostridium sp.]|nr:DUF3109 family protein [Prevotella sp.]MCM1428336.1 DUF3109 family protein [Clostridium sp.]MCM1474808.1 DUF3109 family protein [Muribaculaceae bacterium]
MFQIDDTLVSIDLAERFFCCDLDACHGECCIEGDAGAPLTQEEDRRLGELMPKILPLLTPRAQSVIREEGHSYTDQEGDLVTNIIEGGNCVFTCMEPGGMCLCALEKARRVGDTEMFKPISCALYPVRIKEYDGFTAVNFHRWKICRAAETLGRAKGIRAYEFLQGPLERRFGKVWYAKLRLICEQWLARNPNIYH